jgi:hypothetical protein
MDDRQHETLLDTITALPCCVMISGYWTPRYVDALKNWNTASFQAMMRAGRTATEWLWVNFPAPVALHESAKSNVNRLHTMPTLERRALLNAIAEAWQLELAPSQAAMNRAAIASTATNGDACPGPSRHFRRCRNPSPPVLTMP